MRYVLDLLWVSAVWPARAANLDLTEGHFYLHSGALEGLSAVNDPLECLIIPSPPCRHEVVWRAGLPIVLRLERLPLTLWCQQNETVRDDWLWSSLPVQVSLALHLL